MQVEVIWEHGGLSQPMQAFLREMGLTPNFTAELSVALLAEGEMAACASLDGDVIKGVAVRPAYQGQGLTEQLMTQLRRAAFDRGIRKLFVYTKPTNEMQFRGLSFFPVARTQDALFLESERGGLRNFLQSIAQYPGVCGAAVMNCAPFTLGHRYLVEQAASMCDHLYLFILAEEKGLFPAADRLELVRQGCRDLPHVSVHSTGGYLISNATFPTYFMKDQNRTGEIQCEMDLAVFAGRFAPALHITRRFVGTEPLDPVTRAYNEALLRRLPAQGIAVTEVPRLELEQAPVSASRVRACLRRGDFLQIRRLVPETTYQYLKSHFGG